MDITRKTLIHNLLVFLRSAAILWITVLLVVMIPRTAVRAQYDHVSLDTLIERVNADHDQIRINTERLNNIERHGTSTAQEDADAIKTLAAQVTDLRDTVTTWKGAVLGLGGLISLIEILQALGIISTRIRYRSEVGR